MWCSSMALQPSTRFSNDASSSPFNGGTPPRQGTQNLLAKSDITYAIVAPKRMIGARSEEHTSELQSLAYLVCRLLLEKKKKQLNIISHQHTYKFQSLVQMSTHALVSPNSRDKVSERGPEIHGLHILLSAIPRAYYKHH